MHEKDQKTWAEILAGCAAVVGMAVGAIVIVVAIAALSAFIFMIIWNATVFDIFNGPELSLWQAFLVSVLLSMIGSAFSRK